MRLEDYQEADGLVLLNFARPRAGHGPGKMGQASPIEDIDLGANATFGEDVAVAYDPATQFAAVQLNHYGPRVSALQRYFWGADLQLGIGPPVPGVADQDRAGYTFATVYRPEAMARLANFQTVREITFTVAVPGLNKAEFDQGHSLFRALRGPIPPGTRTVTVQLKSERNRAASLAMDSVAAMFADLEMMGGDLLDGVVKGKEVLDGPTTQVDLVDERLTANVDIQPGLGHRFARPERWIALRDTLHNWQAAGQLV
jgi:hypothetical protein